MEGRDTLDPDDFRFRGLHPRVSLGTASDRYAGWLGQIYSAERFARSVSSRTKRVGGKTFKEAVLPVESVEEYFQHFRVLEIDYTFYRFLLEEDGKASQTFHVLRSYRDHLSESDRLILKVPQAVFARKLLRGGKAVRNPIYLNPEVFTRLFYEPAVALLGANLSGLVFEQEYQRKDDRTSPVELARELDRFFTCLPGDDRYHVELRTESYLAAPVLAVLEKHGVGQVLSHWTWLPPLHQQLAKAGFRFFNAGRQSIIRLMTPLGVRYEDAYARAHPFDQLVEEMMQPRMIQETASLVHESIHRDIHMNVIVNNRAGGNAPLIARRIAKELLAIQTRSKKEDCSAASQKYSSC